MIAILRDRTRRLPCLVAGAATLVAAFWLVVSGWVDSSGFAALNDPQTSRLRRFGLDLLYKLDLLQGVERAAYDWRAWLASRFSPAPTPELGFVYINDRTIQDIGRGETLRGTPYGLLWPRYVYGRVLRELRAQGARAVGFDIFFKDIRHDQTELATESGPVDSDNFLRSEIRSATNMTVVLASLSNSLPAVLFRTGSARLGDAFSLRDTDGMARRVRAYQDYVMPSLPLEVYAINNSQRLVRYLPEVVFEDYETLTLSTNHLDAEGCIELEVKKGLRRTVKVAEHARVWHLGIVLAAQMLGLDLNQAVVEPNRLLLRGTNGVQRVIPIDRHGRMFVDWTVRVRHQEMPEEPFESVLNSDVARQHGVMSDVGTNWLGKYVVIGSVATGNNMADVGPTPLGKEDFLVGTYLNVANSIVQGRFVHRLPVGLEVLLVLFVGVVAWATNQYLTPERATVALGIFAVVYGAVACVAFVQGRLWIPLAHPLGGGLLITHASLLTYRALFEQKERQRVKAVFSRLVSPNVVHELLKLERFALGGARRHLTVFFADVRGFTEMTDRRQAAAEEYVKAHGLTGPEAEAFYEREALEVLDTVNRYLAVIADVIKLRSGTLDKYIGDCVMAFWGAPTPNPLHAVDAVQAAIDAQRAIHQLNLERAQANELRTVENQRRVAAGEPPLPPVEQLSLGTGVNTGTMMVGLMGSEAHTFNYTVFGREVNLASRLEGVSGRARIIIGEATYRELLQHAPNLAALCVMRESVQVKGFRGSVSIYEVLWRMGAEEKTAPV